MILRVPLTVENSEPGCASYGFHLFDFDRAWADPGFGGFGYLKVPFCHPEDGWEEDPLDDPVCRVRLKSERKRSYVFDKRKLVSLSVEKGSGGWEWVMEMEGGDG